MAASKPTWGVQGFCETQDGQSGLGVLKGCGRGGHHPRCVRWAAESCSERRGPRASGSSSRALPDPAASCPATL